MAQRTFCGPDPEYPKIRVPSILFKLINNYKTFAVMPEGTFMNGIKWNISMYWFFDLENFYSDREIKSFSFVRTIQKGFKIYWYGHLWAKTKCFFPSSSLLISMYSTSWYWKVCTEFVLYLFQNSAFCLYPHQNKLIWFNWTAYGFTVLNWLCPLS